LPNSQSSPSPGASPSQKTQPKKKSADCTKCKLEIIAALGNDWVHDDFAVAIVEGFGIPHAHRSDLYKNFVVTAPDGTKASYDGRFNYYSYNTTETDIYGNHHPEAGDLYFEVKTGHRWLAHGPPWSDVELNRINKLRDQLRSEQFVAITCGFNFRLFVANDVAVAAMNKHFPSWGATREPATTPPGPWGKR